MCGCLQKPLEEGAVPFYSPKKDFLALFQGLTSPLKMLGLLPDVVLPTSLFWERLPALLFFAFLNPSRRCKRESQVIPGGNLGCHEHRRNFRGISLLTPYKTPTNLGVTFPGVPEKFPARKLPRNAGERVKIQHFQLFNTKIRGSRSCWRLPAECCIP